MIHPFMLQNFLSTAWEVMNSLGKERNCLIQAWLVCAKARFAHIGSFKTPYHPRKLSFFPQNLAAPYYLHDEPFILPNPPPVFPSFACSNSILFVHPFLFNSQRTTSVSLQPLACISANPLSKSNFFIITISGSTDTSFQRILQIRLGKNT